MFWLSSVQGYGSHQRDLQSLDLVLVSADTGPQIHLRDGSAVRPFLMADTVTLDGAPYYRSFGFGGELTHDANSSWRWSLEARALYRDHRANGRFPALDDRDGANYRVGGDLGTRLSPESAVQRIDGLELQDSRRGYERWRQGEIRLGLLQVLPLPGGDSSIHVGVTGVAGLRSYGSPDATVDAGRATPGPAVHGGAFSHGPVCKRHGLDRRTPPQWQQSNLPNYTWDDLSVSGGMRFGF